MPRLDLGQLAGIFHNSYVLIGNKIPPLRDGFKTTKRTHNLGNYCFFLNTDHQLLLHIGGLPKTIFHFVSIFSYFGFQV